MAAASLQQNHLRHHHHHHNHEPLKLFNRKNNNFLYFKQQIAAKRKSAVEILQETKPLYVKSELVLDRKQEFGIVRNLSHFCYSNNANDDIHNVISQNTNSVDSYLPCSSAPCSSSLINYENSNIGYSSTANYSSTLPLPKSPKLTPLSPALRKSTGSFQLQNKLRKLINFSKEDLDTKCSSSDGKECLNDYNNNSSTNHLIHSGAVNSHLSTPVKYTSVYNHHCSSTYHKSLPDLSNVHTPADDNEIDDCLISVYSNNSGGMNKFTLCVDSTDALSCKNDRLFTSKAVTYPDYFDQRNRIAINSCKNEIEDTSLQTSPIKSYSDDIISPPSLYSDFKIHDFNLSADNSKTRHVLRSKSDVGARSPSSLKTVDIPIQDPSNLNNFFDNLGMDSTEFYLLTSSRSNTSSPVYFDSSDSSVDSIGACASGIEKVNPVNHTNELPSIVERNARIIKWLCNCRKVLKQVPYTAMTR